MAAQPLFMVQETPNVGTSLLFPPDPGNTHGELTQPIPVTQ